MADRNQVRRVHDDGHLDTDPLAELTRIMGFDPRVEPAPQIPDEMGIDLERELMAEVDAGLPHDAFPTRTLEGAPASPASAEASPSLDQDFDQTLASSLEKEFAIHSTWQAGDKQSQPFAQVEERDLEVSSAEIRPADDLATVALSREPSGEVTEGHELEAELAELLSALGAPARRGSPVGEVPSAGPAQLHDRFASDPWAEAESEWDGAASAGSADPDAAEWPDYAQAASAVSDAEGFPSEGASEWPQPNHQEPDDGAELHFDEQHFAEAFEQELTALRVEDSGAPEETSPHAAADLLDSQTADADPFAALASMGLPTLAVAAGYSSVRSDEATAFDESSDDWAATPSIFDDAPEPLLASPEIETTEVHEPAIALPDDLDLPKVAFEANEPVALGFDAMDPDFVSAFQEPAPAPASSGGDGGGGAAALSFDEEFDRIFELEQSLTQGDHDPAQAGDVHHRAYPSHWMAEQGEDEGTGAAVSQASASSSVWRASRRGERNRGFTIAAAVAGLALAGGIGAFVFSVNGSGDAEPALIKADTGPVKVKPENPGGAVVPNQDNKVYERVTEGPLEPPAQEKLISGAEEPIELAETDVEPTDEPFPGQMMAEELPGVELANASELVPAETAKAEDRIEPEPDIASLIANDDVVAVSPRRVRTMIVRPDGTLVPREEPAVAPEPAPVLEPVTAAEPAPPISQEAAPQPSLAPAVSLPAETPAQPAVAAAETIVAASPASLPAADAAAAAASIALQQLDSPATPARVPVAPPRPSDQPVDIVGEVKARNEVAAAAAPQQPVATAGGWSMQIASQPSAEGAQATYDTLAGRYASVLGGRGVNIVKAEIAGKGTFWRVRVPAGSRSEAIELCERYKEAGGSCFVAQ